MTEFRKYKPRELMQGLLDGRIYQHREDDLRCVFIRMIKDDIYILDMSYPERGILKFFKSENAYDRLSVYGAYYKLKEVSDAHVKLLIQKRRKELKSEKGC